MRTRSQDTKDATTVVIDFDEASREWNRNKIRRGQMYFYICGFTLANGRACQRCPKNGETHCYQHQHKYVGDANVLK